MTLETNSNPDNTPPLSETMHNKPHHAKDHPRRRNLAAAAIAGIALLGFGAVAGAGVMKLTGPSIEMAPATPVAITAMADSSLVTIKGKVADIYGNKFIVEDGSGTALIETGRAGEGGTLVAKDEVVSVQGRFDDGVVRATYLIRADGKTEAIGPVGVPPHHGKGGPGWLRHMMD